ncbi:MAG: protein kinase [Chlamydiota bacterium]
MPSKTHRKYLVHMVYIPIVVRGTDDFKRERKFFEEKELHFFNRIYDLYHKTLLNTLFESANLFVKVYQAANHKITKLESCTPNKISPDQETYLKTVARNLFLDNIWTAVFFKSSKNPRAKKEIFFDEFKKSVNVREAQKNSSLPIRSSEHKQPSISLVSGGNNCFDCQELIKLSRSKNCTVGGNRTDLKKIYADVETENWLVNKRPQKRIGIGANGVVFLCDSGAFGGKLIVVKTGLHRRSQPSVQRKIDMLNELKKHTIPNLSQVFDTHVGLGRWAAAFTTISTENLLHVLAKRFLTYEEWSRILKEAAKAVAAMHKRKLIHGDLKPSNVVYNPKRQLVQVIDTEESRRAGTSWIRMGTPGYRPWEYVLTKAAPGPEFDMCSFAFFAYVAWTGRKGISIDKLLAKKLTEESLSDASIKAYLGIWKEFLTRNQWIELQQEISLEQRKIAVRLGPKQPESWSWKNEVHRFEEKGNTPVSRIIEACLKICPQERISAAGLVKMIEEESKSAIKFSEDSKSLSISEEKQKIAEIPQNEHRAGFFSRVYQYVCCFGGGNKPNSSQNNQLLSF